MSVAPKACVIGWPIAHSRSPLIHRYWLRHYKIAGDYERVPVAPADLPAFLGDLASRGYVGCNVTVPHKEPAFALADRADAVARRLKAANTLWLERDGLHASNTDVHGFLANLDETVPGWDDLGGARAVVLGAGGAARAILAGLDSRGISRPVIVNRTPARARALRADLDIAADIYAWHDMAAALDGARLLVNTTTLGMSGQEALTIDLAPLDPRAVVNDIVYVPLHTPLLAAAQARGLRVCDGLGMLLHQAAPGFARWFGVMPRVTQQLRAVVVADIEGGRC